MKQTVEEAASENILFNHRTVDRTFHASVSNMLPIDIHGEFIINERIIKEE